MSLTSSTRIPSAPIVTFVAAAAILSEGCAASAEPRVDDNQEAATYGNNRLKEVKDDPRAAEWKDSVALVIDLPLSDGGLLETLTLAEAEEKALCYYGSQPVPLWTTFMATAFLVAPDIVATAGHVTNTDLKPEDYVFVFGYEYVTDASVRHTFSADRVYRGKERIANVQMVVGDDFGLIRLDRPVTGRRPLPIRRSGRVSSGEPLLTLGHAWGTPLKAARGSVLDNSSANEFRADYASFPGMSGGPIIGLQSHLVEGIHVSGDSTDWVKSKLNGKECYAPRNCDIAHLAERHCASTEATSTVLMANKVPSGAH